MKVDMHTHLLVGEGSVSPEAAELAERWGVGAEAMKVTPETHWEKTAQYTDKTIVFGGRFSGSRQIIDDRYIADYVAQHPDTLVGFMSIDPVLDTVEDIEYKYYDLHLKGIKTSTFYCNTGLADERFAPIFAAAERLGLPMIFHLGPAFPKHCFSKYGDPKPLEGIALRYPKLKIIIAHMGYPYEYELLHIVRRYPNLFVDMSAMVQQPWDFYNKLMMYHEWHYMDKVLLGSDFPFGTHKETYDGLMNVNQFTEGTKLPRIPEKELLQIAERDVLDLLGIDA